VDSGKKPADLDAILLVGGSTRTPLVSHLLSERTGLDPRQDVHPDLCVALGAGVLASRLAGHSVERILVDVSPYSFGVSYLGDRGGVPYPHCYKPIVHRNTPLPLTRTERFYTTFPEQTTVEVQVYQGDDEDALKNIPVGDFRIDGLTEMDDDLNEVLCRMRLDLDGILEVTAVEKCTGKSKHITISGALRARSAEEIAAGRKRIQDLYRSPPNVLELPLADASETAIEAETASTAGAAAIEEPIAVPGPESRPDREIAAHELMERSRRLLDVMHAEDREEAIGLHEAIQAAIQSGDTAVLDEASRALKELLFFSEGQN
jgi:molecular chaperone DnaK (HSP70)